MQSDTSRPLVDIILLNWNNLADTLDCIQSILKSTYPHFEIIVIDNGSDSDPKETLETQFPGIQVVRNSENRGYTGGNNQGIYLALERKADYVWLLNADAIVAPDALGELVRAAENSPETGLLSPVIYFQNDPNKVLWCGGYLDISACEKHITNQLEELTRWLERSPEKVCVWGTALLIRRSLIEQIGLLDERFFAYWEDYDYSIRSIQSGSFNQIVASARIFHHTKAQYPSHYYYYMKRNEYYFWMKYLPASRKGAFRRSYLARAIQQTRELIAKDEKSQAQACLAGVWHAWRNQFGEWNAKDHMPRLLAATFLAFPGLWDWMLKGNLHQMKKTIFGRL